MDRRGVCCREPGLRSTALDARELVTELIIWTIDDSTGRGLIRLRIAFDGHALTSPAGGVRRYISELGAALVDLDAGIELVAVGARRADLVPRGIVGVPAPALLPTNLGWSVAGLPLAARSAGFDVFHAPAYTAPLWGVRPLVLTIHDVSYERHPEWYPHAGGVLRRAFYRRSARVADVIITDSEFSRREIELAYGIGGDRVRVIPLGVGPPFLGAAPDAPPPAAGAAPAILHVGDLHARRNLNVVVRALAHLRARGGLFPGAFLVLAGRDLGGLASLMAEAGASGVREAIRWIPDADDRQVIALYRQARVVVYPSLYEGFGLPALEAMAVGVPVVAARSAAVPEVVGEAGLLVDPHDAAAWADAIAAIIGSPGRAAALSAAGRARAARFSWRRTAEMTRDVYADATREGVRARA